MTALVRHGLLGSRVLVGVSGGADSVALLRALARIQRQGRLTIVVGHVHHGSAGKNLELQVFRDGASNFVEELAGQLGLKFVSAHGDSWNLQSPAHASAATSKGSLSSEAQFRALRKSCFESWLKKHQCRCVITAHTETDLLETRVMRLLRGVSLAGLSAIQEFRPPFFRPFLTVEGQALRDYLNELRQEWIEDPSNLDPKYFRNWLRTVWLKDLRKRDQALTKNLARSLRRIALESHYLTDLDEKNLTHILDTNGVELSRKRYSELTRHDQKRVLAHYVRSYFGQDMRATQIEELVKRLDTPKKNTTFKLIGLSWTLNASNFWARPHAGFIE